MFYFLWLSIDLPFINWKFIIVPSKHGIEGVTKNKSKISIDLLGALVASLQLLIDTTAVDFAL